MKITEPAKAELEKIIKDNGADGLQVVLQQSCCGTSPVFQLVRFEEGDQPELVDGFQILMEPEAKSAIEEVLIDLKDGELVVYNTSCGCSGGCGDHECGSGC